MEVVSEVDDSVEVVAEADFVEFDSFELVLLLSHHVEYGFETEFEAVLVGFEVVGFADTKSKDWPEVGSRRRLPVT